MRARGQGSAWCLRRTRLEPGCRGLQPSPALLPGEAATSLCPLGRPSQPLGCPLWDASPPSRSRSLAHTECRGLTQKPCKLSLSLLYHHQFNQIRDLSWSNSATKTLPLAKDHFFLQTLRFPSEFSRCLQEERKVHLSSSTPATSMEHRSSPTLVENPQTSPKLPVSFFSFFNPPFPGLFMELRYESSKPSHSGTRTLRSYHTKCKVNAYDGTNA